jgi:predicted HTH transcriptional regulator
MPESQHIEWKETWRDEFLKWICGFANAEGGVLHIGRNDKGVVVGVQNAAKLLEDIPNKVRDILGILVAVNLRTECDRRREQRLFLAVGKTPGVKQGRRHGCGCRRRSGERWDGGRFRPLGRRGGGLSCGRICPR